MCTFNELCVVCSNPAMGYNYGAIVCSACRMFFKRAIIRKSVKNCDIDFANCKTTRCSFCRFQKCLQEGMIYNPYSKAYDFQNCEVVFSATLKNLIYLDNHRQHLFLKCYFNGDPSILETSRSLTFTEKPKDFKESYQNWSFMSCLTALDFLRKLNFMKKLEPMDQRSILENSFKYFAVFTTGQASYESKKSYLEFPDGSEVPENLEIASKSFRNRIQCRLIGKMIDLKLTREEYLLLSVILICNPCTPNLSVNGTTIICTQQKYYTAALFHYCSIIQGTASGPSRFSELLFLLK